MTATDYIEEKLRVLASKFTDIKIRYEHRSNTGSHLIEIVPLSFFEGNGSYLEEETKIEDEFELLFPSENIVFVSEGSLTVIKRADLELGYDKISFDNNTLIIDFEVTGYSGYLEIIGITNYALAA